MKTNEAKRIISEVYNELIARLENSDTDISESEIIDFLHTIAKGLSNTSFQFPLNLHTVNSNLENDYETLARQSIDSYRSSNDAISSIHQRQSQILDDAHIQKNLIDSSSLLSRFQEVQDHMNSEVTKANETISSLLLRINDLERKSNTDPLTKVLNRKAMDDYLLSVCSHTPLSENFHLMMIDIDDFKEINDSFGHLAGDKVLIFLSSIFKKTVREGDKIFRYGGEEFVIVVNRTDTKGSVMVAERILELVRQNKLLFKSKQMSITLSIGITHCVQNDAPENIIERADKALYRAKSLGKNQFQIDEG